MQAVILAAGMGRRLKELTKDQAKCMVKVNGLSLIERMIRQLEGYQLTRIILVVGHKKEKLIKLVKSLKLSTPIIYIDNNVYESTNNIYSLSLAKEYLVKEDTILLESDLIFEQKLLDQLVFDPYPNLALVAPFESWMDGTVVLVDRQYRITNFLTRKDFEFEKMKTYYKTVNIYKFSAAFSATHYVPFLEAYCKALGNNEYYEQVLKVISLLDDHGLKALSVTGGFWYEIDDEQDLDIAESIFTDAHGRFQKLSQRFGGYWRYPGLIDFCYLVNPYFPNQRLLDEIKANLEQLIISYPSSLQVNNLLAAKSLGLRQNQVVVGNGASELIKVLLKGIPGKTGIIYPAFEEYAHCANEAVPYYVESDDFCYGPEDLIRFCEKQQLHALVLVNPDNPTGNYIDRGGLIRLAEFCRQKELLLILDESFADFSDSGDSMLEPGTLDHFPNLIVIKSISKSYGVPGFRLGILAGSNQEMIRAVEQSLPIWNINALGEYFLQIFEKYQNDYQLALIRFREERRRMLAELTSLRQLHVIPSQANYFTIEILDGGSSLQICELLLNRYHILIKDLSGKRGMRNKNYIRVAIKDRNQNEQLIEALKHILR